MKFNSHPITLVLAILSQSIASALADGNAKVIQDYDKQIESIQVTGVRTKLEQAGRLKDTILKTEVLDAAAIDYKNALSLTEAIQDEPGVRVSNECSMCGVKRVMMNGMKGEHTTILIDGVPTHTLISGFYAVDAVATTGVDRIEIARGSGASLIAPEAIGGTINIISKEVQQNNTDIDLSAGSHQYKAARLFSTLVLNDGKSGWSITGQYDGQDQEDHDDNLVSEAPKTENASLITRFSHDFNASNNLQLRYAHVESEIFGGPVLGKNISSVNALLASYDKQPLEQLFQDNDVRKLFIAKPWQTAEWIDTTRDEAYFKWLSEINGQWTLDAATSFAKHQQDSFYEGIDYRAKDSMHYAHIRLDYMIDVEQSASFGFDIRDESMRSDSDALSQVPSFVSDSFDYQTTGFFAQYHYAQNDWLEISTAVRVDHIKADFIDPSKPDVEIDDTLLSPRIDVRLFHNSEWTSRLSVGQGYRAPLSFFETDHGILDTEKGFQIDISEPEQSLSVNYSLSFDQGDFSTTVSAASSLVKHMATLSANDDGVPVLSQLSENARVTTIDAVAGYSLSSNLTLNLAIEKFTYDHVFRSSYAIAPIEKRVGFDAIYKTDMLESSLSWTWFGRRDLSRYGYDGFDISGDPASLKATDAPAFSTINLKVQLNLNADQSVYAGVANITDKLQLKDGQSPLFFDAEGSYDVGYIYGPLHGRELYAGYKISF